MIRKILGISNIVVSIVGFIIIHFIDVSSVFSTIMMMSLFIGWIMPYIGLILSGIGILIHTRYKINIIFNIFNILLCSLMIFLVVSLYNKSFLVFIIEYGIMIVINILNIIYTIVNKDTIIKDNLQRDILG